MRLIQVITLISLVSVSYAAFSLNGPHGDGRFLAHPVLINAKACPDGQFNKLTVDTAGTGLDNYDEANTKYATQCTACSSATFKGIYTAPLSGLTGDYVALNRGECCYNSNHVSCREELRAYKEGCHGTGTYDATTNTEGHGGGSCS